MNLDLSLKKQSDNSLISNLKELVSKEREILTKILHYLKEIEARRLYLARGYPSMFAFLTEYLGYGESAAHRRISAMRLIRDIPEVKQKIETGKISLSVASQAQGFFQREEKKRKQEKTPNLSQTEKLDLIQKLEGTSSRSCEKKLAQISPESALPREKTRPISEENTLIQFVADQKLMKKINKLKELLSHQNPHGRYDQLFEKVVDMALEKLDPERREARRQQRKAKCTGPLSTSKVTPPTRHIPQPLRDQVWVRDKGQCQFKDRKTGKICGSKKLLQIDHKYPFALGGEHSLKNLRLRCFKHNQFHAEQALGFEFLNKKPGREPCAPRTRGGPR